MQVGFTLCEEMKFSDARSFNASLADTRSPACSTFRAN